MIKTYHYFIFRLHDNYIRIGFLGAAGKEDGFLFFQTIPKATEITYIDEFPMVIKADVDEWEGIGNRVFGSSTIVTCKHLYQMRTIRKKKDKTFFEQMKEIHQLIKRQQEEFLKKKEEKKLKNS